MMKEPHLSSHLSLRAVTQADAEAVAKLIYTVCEADGDTTVADSAEELLHQWNEPGFNLSTNALLIETEQKEVVGYEILFNEHGFVHFEMEGYVHPKYKDMGIGSSLLFEMENKARKQMAQSSPELRAFIYSTFDGKDEAGKKLHTELGYSPIRFFWRMEITLQEAPIKPELPAGLELRPFEKDQHAHAMWQADNEAFGAHWGSHATTFEEWQFRKFDRPDADPSMWLVLWDGDQIAGFSQNRYRNGIGWVGTLGVRAPWRKLGLGQALLQMSFSDFYQRGTKTIGLGVDAANSTGATRLYQRVGMRVVSEFVTFEREIRSGKTLEDAKQRI